MLKNIVSSFIFLSAVLLLNATAFAEDSPTLDQVYQAAHAGRMDEAQRMMDKVLKDHPNSAKAHFVEAELLAKQGQMSRADTELKAAEQLKPDLSFAKPQAVQELKALIYSTHRVSQSPTSSNHTEQGNSFPWGLILLGIAAIVIITMIMRAISARNAPVYPGNYQPGMQNAAGSPMPMQPYGGGMGGMAPMGQMGGGMGSGIMGGLATGAALGVGMVAGEALAHRFMDGGSSAGGNVAPVADSWGNSSGNMGGSDFGIADSSSWSDSSNVADSGSGGGDWG
jgi:hypothetical protein